MYELLKEININNCGVNDIGMELGDFPQMTNGKDNETSNTEIQVQTEDIGNENSQFPSECGDSLRRNPIDSLNQDAGNHSTNQEGPRIRSNCPTPLQFGQPLLRPIVQHECRNHMPRSKFHEQYEYKNAKRSLTLNADAPAEPISNAKIARQLEANVDV
ncbi:hypothetical protein O181_121201 [Austropuccinia psidii MF-1]|uniref:Uncharacterized protein n=1 Tax=Austropuccinia psidii MF-1 TaxID=1389203 RepID=A0A9Q3KJY2_9BASI|nr:hypothetical protein [Austropuccinia psidii MF-1]